MHTVNTLIDYKAFFSFVDRCLITIKVQCKEYSRRDDQFRLVRYGQVKSVEGGPFKSESSGQCNWILQVNGKNKRRFTVSLKDGTKAKGAKFFIKKSELVEKLMEKFEEMGKYYK